MSPRAPWEKEGRLPYTVRDIGRIGKGEAYTYNYTAKREGSLKQARSLEFHIASYFYMCYEHDNPCKVKKTNFEWISLNKLGSLNSSCSYTTIRNLLWKQWRSLANRHNKITMKCGSMRRVFLFGISHLSFIALGELRGCPWKNHASGDKRQLTEFAQIWHIYRGY
jgi:hypothetical protein